MNMRKRICFFKIRIRFKEHLSSLSLTFCPFVGRFEKQISAASQQLLVGVTVCKHNWSVCFTQTFGLFPGVRVCLNSVPSMCDAHLLYGITGDLIKKYQNDDGIVFMDVFDFLLDKDSI